MQIMDDDENCPFCGSANIEFPDDGHNAWCRECHAVGPGPRDASSIKPWNKDAAKRAWKTRTVIVKQELDKDGQPKIPGEQYDKNNERRCRICWGTSCPVGDCNTDPEDQ